MYIYIYIYVCISVLFLLEQCRDLGTGPYAPLKKTLKTKIKT